MPTSRCAWTLSSSSARSRSAFLTRDVVRAHDAAAEPVEARRRTLGARVLLEHVGALERDEQLAAAGVLELDALVSLALEL